MEEALQLDQLGRLAIPVASNTSALKRWSAGASGLNTAASSPAAAAMRAHRVVERRRRVGAHLGQHPRGGLGHAARAAEQHAAGQLAGPRSSSTGCGSPIRFATVPATGSRTSCE